MKYFIIHLDAGHSVNGNPRRCYEVYDSGGVICGSFDEGYKGYSAVPEEYRKKGVVLTEIKTTFAEYKYSLKYRNR